MWVRVKVNICFDHAPPAALNVTQIRSYSTAIHLHVVTFALMTSFGSLVNGTDLEEPCSFKPNLINTIWQMWWSLVLTNKVIFPSGQNLRPITKLCVQSCQRCGFKVKHLSWSSNSDYPIKPLGLFPDLCIQYLTNRHMMPVTSLWIIYDSRLFKLN